MLHFPTNYLLEDARTLLRPLEHADLPHLLPFALHEPEIWNYSMSRAVGEGGMRAYIDAAIAARQAEREYAFIVFDKKQVKYAGSTRFYDIILSQHTLQLGYTWYGKQFQGTGLNKHCKFLMLQFAFDVLGMERVEFRADVRNQRSIAAMKSIGCTAEGILRSNGWSSNGTRRDSVVLSILKKEWNESIKTLLQEKIKTV